MTDDPAQTGLAAPLRAALATPDRFAALTAIRELILERNQSQRVVVFAYACILEIHSAGLPMLLDRFDDHDLDQLEMIMEEIGALGVLADLCQLRGAIGQLVVRDGLSLEQAT